MKCKLCNQEKELMESHVIPKFVFRWQKEKSGAHIRNPFNPNLRIQDGLKNKLLCSDCEQTFSKFETVFSKDIFYPHVIRNKTVLRYDEILLKFSISVLWRVLLTKIGTLQNPETNHIDEIREAENEWRDFLFNNIPLNKFDKVYFFSTTHGLNYTVQPVERFLNYYASAVDAEIVSSENTCLVYVKLARIMIIGEIKNNLSLEFTNKIISKTGGFLNTEELNINYVVKNFLIARVTDINKHIENFSEKQKNIAFKHLKEIKDEEIHKIIIAQENMIIDKDFIDF